MSKISTYEVAPIPKLSDKLIGTSVGGEIEDITYNFTLFELLQVFLPEIPANNLQGILDYGNTATQDINLFGTITTTNLSVIDTANLYITYLNEETHVVGTLFDSSDSVGTAGQVLTSTEGGVAWYTLPPIFTPTLQQVLTEGNTSDIDIILDADIEALDVSTNTATINNQLSINGSLKDKNASTGSGNQVLSSTVTGIEWTDLPVYSAASPLLFDVSTKVFSIQLANSTQGGYLSANDWVTFDGKQNAGPYITALTGEASANGPGSSSIILSNSAVINKVLTGLNVTGGSISSSDSILSAFGKVQSQINGLLGGVQYQGVWNAATNVPILTSSVGVQGHYYIVDVDGNTDLNGYDDWKAGDWAIFSGGSWEKVDNTDSVTSVNGQIGAVSLSTDNIPEGAINEYFTESRARASLSFAAGSGAYNNLTGVITIPTNTNQLTNGASFITLGSLSGLSPLFYNILTGEFSIQQATALQNGYLSATDWNTFNSKQPAGDYVTLNTTQTISGAKTFGATITSNRISATATGSGAAVISALAFDNAVAGSFSNTTTFLQNNPTLFVQQGGDGRIALFQSGTANVSVESDGDIDGVKDLILNGTIKKSTVGTTYTYNLPNANGTIALTSDIPSLIGYVPYTGATTNVDLGTNELSGKYLVANGAAALGGVLSIKQDAAYLAKGNGYSSIASSNIMFDFFGYTGASTYKNFALNFNGLTDNTRREYTLPNANGTLALISDIPSLSNYVTLNTAQTITAAKTFSTSGGDNTLVINHSSGSGVALSITKGGNGEGIYVNKSSGSGNAVTIVGTLNATTLVKNGGTSSQFLKADGSVDSTSYGTGSVTSVAAITLGTSGFDLSSTVANGTTTPVITLNVPNASSIARGVLLSSDWTTFNNKQNAITLTTTGSSGLATLVGSTLNIPNYGSALSGYLPLSGGTLTGALGGTSATFTGNLFTGGTFRLTQSSTVDIQAYTGSAYSNLNHDAASHNWQTSGGTAKMVLNSSGNLGLGVTPSAWGLGKAIEVGSGSTFWGVGITQTQILNNNYFDGSTFIYKNNGNATRLRFVDGNFEWYTAPSGTAGNAISFTQVMTLNASGNLLIGTTTDAGYKLDVNGISRFNEIRVKNIYTNTYTTDSTWNTNKLVVPNNALSGNATYLIEFDWDFGGVGNVPYFASASTIFRTNVYTNGTGPNNEVSLITSSHVGGGFIIYMSMQAQSGNTIAGVNVRFSWTPGGTGGSLTVNVKRIG